MGEFILSPILQPLGQHVVVDTIGILKQKLASSKNLGETFKLLNDVVLELDASVKDREAEVKSQPSKITTASYDLWKTRVKQIGVEMEGIKKEYNNRPPRYSIWRRSRLGEKMEKKCLEYAHLLDEGYHQAQIGILVDKPPEPVIKVTAPDIRGFPTLQSPLETILKSLKHDNIQLIGIYGMVGVGKTTVMLNLNNHEEVAALFDMVIWVKLPTKPNEVDLRQAIAKRLELDKKGITNPDSKMISQALQDKKCLLLLDDVTENLDLHEIGVPHGCKVVMTARSRPVCKLMADKIITIQPLSAEEAWKMFRDITADVVHLPGIEPLARMVANKCARLPLLLKAVASSFKLKDNAALWRVGLRNLQRWPEAGIEGVKEMYEFLKFCYDELKDDTARQCFFYGALFPADSKIYTNYLLECWTAEGFFDSIVDDDAKSYQAMRDVGYDILNHLTEVSLMEKGDKMIYVLMTNCIQEFAFHLLSQHPHHKVVVESRSLEEWQQANRISMIGNKVFNLPERSKCSALLTLLLQRNSELVTIPPLFFKAMCRLVVLDLSGTGIESLPSSIADLSALKALYLNDCILLKELPPEIAKLEQLEVLDIRGSGISFIPRHIQYLLNLRSLRMSYNKLCERGDEECCAEVISKLAKLEELIIDVILYKEWCTEVKYAVREVAGLRSLTTLRFCFPELEHLETFMNINSSWRDHLSSFRFFIGCPNLKRPLILQQFEYKIDRYVRYSDGDLSDKHIICKVLEASEALELIGHKDIVTLSDFLGDDKLENVRGCLIQRCNQMETVVHGGGSTEDGRVLPVLEQLYLRNMYSLKCVFGGELKLESLSRLQILELKDCPKLTMIVSNGVIKQLSELRKLTVEECAEIEELIVEASEQPVLQKLETLRLVNLPKLRCICANQSLSWPSLEMLKIDNCPELKTFPFNKDNAPRLGHITGKREWWDTLQWQDTKVKKQLERFCSLRL